MANIVKLNEVNPDVIKLQLFPFSLRDTTTSWFESLPYGSIDNWEDLVEAYLGRFFSPALTSERGERSFLLNRSMNLCSLLGKDLNSY